MARFPLLLLVPLIALAIPPAPFDVVGTASVAGKGIPDAVVWLEAPSVPHPAHAREVVLDQRNLNFYPHVLVVEVGTRVKFPNDDRVFHNVFSYHDGKRFDLGLYPVGAVKYVPFDQPGLSRIFCNIHPQMAAYVMVVDTPYFALSDESGRFEITGVPAGEYPSHAWRPGGPVLNLSVVVGPASALDVRWP
jgi:plastocyanin